MCAGDVARLDTVGKKPTKCCEMQCCPKKGEYKEIVVLKVGPCWRICIEPTKYYKYEEGKEVPCAWTYVIEISLENSFDDVQNFILSLFAEPGCSFSMGEGGMPKKPVFVKIEGYQFTLPTVGRLQMVSIPTNHGGYFEGFALKMKDKVEATKKHHIGEFMSSEHMCMCMFHVCVYIYMCVCVYIYIYI